MRNFSLIAILLALVIATLGWKYVLDKNTDRLETITPGAVTFDEPSGSYDGDGQEVASDYETETPGEYEEVCGPGDDSPECAASVEESEQEMLENQRDEAYDTMMRSFDEGMEAYRDSIGGNDER